MSETYTRKDLDSMSRVELRRLAVQVHGMDNKECSNTKSEEIKAYIEEAQGGGGKSTSKGSSTKAAAKPEPSNGKPATRGKARSSKAKAAPPTEEVASDLSAVLERIDAVGKAIDEGQETTKEELGGIVDQLCDIDKKLFILTGLATDLYKAMYEPDDLDPRIEELEAEYDAEPEGNAEGETE